MMLTGTTAGVDVEKKCRVGEDEVSCSLIPILQLQLKKSTVTAERSVLPSWYVFLRIVKSFLLYLIYSNLIHLSRFLLI
jgi:hypothetical protein